MMTFAGESMERPSGLPDAQGKIDDFCIKNDELCIKNDGCWIKNDELCINNDEWCIKIEERQRSAGDQRQRLEIGRHG